MAQVKSKLWCSVPRCFNSKQKQPYLTFHSFPRDIERRKTWARAVRRDQDPRFNVNGAQICSMHFRSSDIVITVGGKKRIHKDAVPCIFPWDSDRPSVMESVNDRSTTRSEVLGRHVGPSDLEDAGIVNVSVSMDHDYVQPFVVAQEKPGGLESSLKTSPHPHEGVGTPDSRPISPPPVSPASLPEESHCSPLPQCWSTTQEGAHTVPLSSLRLCVAPLRLLSAIMWRVVEQRLIKHYIRLERFVSAVLEVLPELLSAEKRAELPLGLRAKFILELCRDAPSVNIQELQPHLTRLYSIAGFEQNRDPMVDAAVQDFCGLIQTIVTDPRERTKFFQDIYPLRYGDEYDTALKSIVWEFLSKLEKLLPVPSFHQVASCLDEDALQSKNVKAMNPRTLQNFLQCVKDGLFDPVSSSSSIKPNTILSTLAATITPSRSPCEPDTEKCASIPRVPQSVSGDGQSRVDGDRDGFVKEAEDDDGCGGGVNKHDIQRDPNEEDLQGKMDEGTKWIFNLKSCNKQNRNGCTSDQENPGSSRSEKMPPRAAGGSSVAPATASQRILTAISRLKSPTRETGSVSVTDGRERSHSCSVCGTGFESQLDLKKHQTVHRVQQQQQQKQQQPHACSVCGKTFRRPYMLVCHTRVHTGEKPYGCSVCGRSFMQQSDLTAHKRIHSGVKPYMCSVCGKVFRTSSGLKAHTRTHTGEHPYKCELCGKSYRMASTLTAHRRSHMKKRPHHCSVCDKRFSTRSMVKRHMRTHTPYECHLCGKRFSAAVSWKIHQRAHR